MFRLARHLKEMTPFIAPLPLIVLHYNMCIVNVIVE